MLPGQPSSAESLAWVDEALSDGENLVAFDRAQRALDEVGADLTLEHRLVLALARSGATRRAEEAFEQRRLLDRAAAAEPVLAEDLRALSARLAKDRAMATDGDQRRRWAELAAARYEVAAQGGVTAYPVVNAATMYLLAGDTRRAHTCAEQALTFSGATADGSYWAAASEAEAWIVVGDLVQAEQALDRAASLPAAVAARSSTRRQLALLGGVTGSGSGLLDRLPVPGSAHFVGHRLNGFGDDEEAALRRRVDDALDAHEVGRGYGSLAAGADLVIVEALLDRGAEVRAVLPFDRDEFVERAVRPAGLDWVDRFESVIGRIDESADSSVHQTVDGPYRGDDCLYGHASRLSMGRCLLRARALVTEPVQIAVWDESDEVVGPAGTGADVAAWRAAGHRTHRIEPVGSRVRGGSRPSDPPRQIMAALFGDVSGFSRLGDDRLPDFFAELMGTLGRVLDDAGACVRYRNTWGDGLYVVVDSASQAAAVALDLQAAMTAVDLPAIGLPDDLHLRLGGHAGPMFEARDRVRDEPTYFGRAVTTAARIEPRTPEGEVYVTGAFAALLALEGDGTIVPEYVGHVATAKGYGDLPMYVLVRR